MTTPNPTPDSPTSVDVEDHGAVRMLVLSRPERLNAFDQAMCVCLAASLKTAEDDDTVHVVLLTGRGRAFSAGTDLFELASSGDFRGGPDGSHAFEDLLETLIAFSKPLVVAVNGIAVGLGVTLLGHADLVFMANTARLQCPFTRLGIAPEAASSATLPQLVGRQAASWLLMSSQWIDAASALSIGLVWKVTSAGDVVEQALAHAQQLAAQPLSSLVASKRLILASFGGAIEAAHDRENAEFDLLLGAPEHRAAVASFLSRGAGTEDKQ